MPRRPRSVSAKRTTKRLKRLKIPWITNLGYFLEVRFKDNGLDLIEVQDNGGGISPDNYESVGELHNPQDSK